MEEDNTIDFTFLDEEEKSFDYSVMIVLNSNFCKEQFLLLQKKSDFLIIVDGAVNEIYDKFFDNSDEKKEFDINVDMILADEQTARPEVLKFFKDKNVKQMAKNEQSFFDLGKCLYYSLEKISENVDTDYVTVSKNTKRSAIFIVGLTDGRIDLAFSIIQNINYYMNTEFAYKTEFYMVSKSSMSVFLKNGVNIIYPSKKWENREQGYSVVSLQDGVQLNLVEYEKDKKVSEVSKNSSFVNSIFKKNFSGEKIQINIDGISKGFVMYSSTTIFHDL